MKLSWMRWECGFPDQGAGRPVMSCCGARNLLLAVRSQDFDRCHSLLLAASAAGGARKRPLLRCPKSFARCPLTRFRPLPLLIARCIRRRRRSQTSPLRVPSVCRFKISYPPGDVKPSPGGTACAGGMGEQKGRAKYITKILKKNYAKCLKCRRNRAADLT